MHPKLLKYQCSYTKEADRKNPKIRGGIEMFKKPDFLINSAPVSINNIHHWIQFKESLHGIGLKH